MVRGSASKASGRESFEASPMPSASWGKVTEVRRTFRRDGLQGLRRNTGLLGFDDDLSGCTEVHGRGLI